MHTIENIAVLTDLVGTTFGSKRTVKGGVAAAAALAMDCDEEHVTEAVTFFPKQYVNRAAAAIAQGRQIHRAYTTPWDEKGRLCACAVLPLLKQALQAPMDTLEQVAKDIGDKRDEILEEARGKIRNPEMWSRFQFPGSDELRAAYTLTLSINRIPAGDPHTQYASQKVVDEIVAQEKERTLGGIAAAGSTVIVRLDKMIFRVLSTLRTKDSQFQKSLIGDFNEWCPVFLDIANLSGDAEVMGLIERAKRELGWFDVETLREVGANRDTAIDLSVELLKATSGAALRLGFGKDVDDSRRAFNRDLAGAEARKAKKDPEYKARTIDIDDIDPEAAFRPVQEAKRDPGEAERDPGEAERDPGEAERDPGEAERDPLVTNRVPSVTKPVTKPDNGDIFDIL
jgi:hypothetical protein